MTDDLDMGAILNEVTFEQAIQEAVRAGNDLVMICHRLEMVELAREHLEGVESTFIHDALRRIEATKKRLVRPDHFSLEKFAAINDDIWQLRVDTLGLERAQLLSIEDGKRSPVELY
jgi:beta-N-acetylhexosaminidase